MARKRNYENEVYKNSGSVGYSQKALAALDTGSYRGRQQRYRTSDEQVQSIPKQIPALEGMSRSPEFNSRVDTNRARQRYAERINYAPLGQQRQTTNNDNYVVNRNRYAKLMQDNRLANDIKLLAQVNYQNANQDATVSDDWANEYGAKRITGGMNKDQFVKTLSRRYGLTSKELNDMALTFHTDANKADVANYGKKLKKIGEAHPVLGSAGSFVGTLGSGVEGAYNTVVGGLTGDDRFLSNMFSTTKKSPREGAKKNIKSNVGKTAYDVGMGIGDMAVGAAAGSAPVILAGNTANEAQSSAINRGSSVRKASAYGAGAGALDFITNKIGLDKAKKLAVNEIKSTGIKKLLAQNAIAGVGEAAENVYQDIGQSLIDSLLNGENAELTQSFNDKKARGMSDSDAFKAVAKEYATQLATSGAIGFGMGSAMQAGSTVAPKIPSLLNRQSRISEVDNAIKQANQAAAEIDRLSQQIPKVEQPTIPISTNNVTVPSFAKIQADLEASRKANQPKDYSIQTVYASDHSPRYFVRENIDANTSRPVEPGKVYNTKAQANEALNRIQGAIPNKNVAENAARNPRLVKALEGEELAQAKQHIADNDAAIQRLDNEINVLKNDPNNLWRGQLKKKVQAEIKAKENQQKALAKDTTDTNKRIKGGITPIKELLSDDQRNAIYSNENGIYKELNFAVKFAGDTAEAKDLRTSAKKSLNKFVESNDPADLRDFYNNVIELDNLAKSTNAEYATKSGTRYNYNDYFEVPAGEEAIPHLMRRVMTSGALQAVPDTHSKYAMPESTVDIPHQLASKYAQAYQGFDTYDYMDNAFENDGFVEQMADDIANGRDLTQYIDRLFDDIEDAPDDQIRGQMQGLIDELSAMNKKAGASAPKGIDVYRGYNRSDNPLEGNLANQKTIYDVIGRENPNQVDMLPLEYYTDNLDDATHYANHDKELFDLAQQKGADYETLTGRKPEFNGHVEKHTINPRNVLDLSELGEQTSVDAIYNYLSQLTGKTPSEIDDILRLGAIEKDANGNVIDLPSFSVLRNFDNGEGAVGTRFVDFMRNNGYDAVKYKEGGANHYALLNDTNENVLPKQELPTAAAGGNMPPRIPELVNLPENKNAISRVASNTAINAKIIDQNMLENDPVIRDIASYERHSNAKTLESALANVKSNGDTILDDYNSGRKAIDSDQDVDQAMILLKNLTDQMNEGADVEAQRNLLFSRLRKSGTQYAQLIQAFAKWNDTAEGAIINGERITADQTKVWESEHQSQVKANKKVSQKLVNALSQDDGSISGRVKEPPTYEELVRRVKNTLDKEMSSVDDFTDADYRYIAGLIQDGATTQELADAMNTRFATGKFGVSAETQQKVVDLFNRANKFDPNSKEAVEAKAEAYKLIADEVVMDATPLEKFEAWRYLAMLGNPKTMLRNYVGNKMFAGVTGFSNNLSAALEAGTSGAIKGGKWLSNKAFKTNFDTSKGIQRTKTFLNPVKDSNLIKASGNDLENHMYSRATGSKYEKGTRDAIRSQKSVFDSKWAQLYEKITDKGISDYNAVKKKYSTSLAGYLKANGLDESIFKADDQYRALKNASRTRKLSDAEIAKMEDLEDAYKTLEKARDYAMNEAEYATFHEDNAIASWLTKMSQSAPAPARMIIEGLVPFKKTPANILKSGVEYSPLNAIKSIAQTGKLIFENTGKRKYDLGDTYIHKGKLSGKEYDVNRTMASEVLDNWAKTLTGSMLVGLGYYLKNKGVLNSSEEDEKYQDELEGLQNYSITINGKTYTLDWAAPAVMPLLVGAEISKIKDRGQLLNKKIYENLDDVIGTANALLDPILETSMMQGVKNTLESAANEVRYSDNGAIGGILGSMAANTMTGYLTQALPTLSGQIARTVDPMRRATDTATNQAFLGGVEKQGRKLMNKIPGLSMFNEEYRDAYGRTQTNSPFNNSLANLAYQMLSPSYIDEINQTDADKMARNVFMAKDAEGKPLLDSKVFAQWKNKVTENDQKFSPQEMSTYRQASGEANYEIRDALSKEDWFNNLDGEKQAGILKKVNTLVDKIGKEAAGHEQDSKELTAYKEGGLEGLFDALKDSQANKTLTDAGISTSSNIGKEIKEDIKAGNTEVAQQKIEQVQDDKSKAEQYGFVKEDGSVNMQAYYNGIDYAGDDPQSLQAYADYRSQGFKKDAQRVPYLKDNNTFTDEQKGRIIGGLNPDKMPKAAKGMYDIAGYEGVWNYYLLKNLADTDGNGRVSKAERDGLLNSANPYVTAIPDDQYYYLAGALK